MAKFKNIEVRRDYLSNHGNGEQRWHTIYSPTVSNYAVLKESLATCIKNNDLAELKKLLHSEYIHPEASKCYETITLDTFPKYWVNVYCYAGTYMVYPCPDYNQGQRETSTIEEYRVAPLLEELLVNHQDDFLRLLKNASNECQNELLDFSKLDLSDVDLSTLRLQEQDLLAKVNFSHCNLLQTKGLTQELLNNSQTYVHAQLAQEFIAYWSEAKKQAVLDKITELEKYSRTLWRSPFAKAHNKSDAINKLAPILRNKINSTTKYNGQFQQEFLRLLQDHEKELSPILNQKRFYGLKTILANIALAVLGVGVFYVAAGALHQWQTGRFFFFDRTRSEEKVADIKESALQAPAC